MEILDHLEGLISSRITQVRDSFTLFKLEAKLAGLNVLPLLICACAILSLLTILGLNILSLIGYVIYAWTKQPLAAFGVVILLNIIITLYIAKKLKHSLEQMSFKKTRECLGNSVRSDSYDGAEETIRNNDLQLSQVGQASENRIRNT